MLMSSEPVRRANDHKHTACTVHGSRDTHQPAVNCHAHNPRIIRAYSLNRWALDYKHRYKSKQAIDSDVDKNNSHDEHLKKGDVHYGKYSSIELFKKSL